MEKKNPGQLLKKDNVVEALQSNIGSITWQKHFEPFQAIISDIVSAIHYFHREIYM